MVVGPAAPPRWASQLAETGAVRLLCSDEGWAQGAAVSLAVPPAGSIPCTASDGAWPWLSDAFDALEPGGLLVIQLTGRRARRSRSRGPAAAPTDPIGTALFRAGFVDPRFVTTKDETLWVLARRGLDEPPTRRPQVLSVVLPVFNERATFGTVMEGLLAKSIPGMEIEIILVESNSTDGTREQVEALADDPRVTAIFEERPRGKGHAVRAGLARARGDFVLIQDADLEYSLDDYEALLRPLRDYEASFVLGRRLSPHGSWGMRRFEAQLLISRAINVGHVIFLGLFNAVYRTRLKDPFTMYKVFRGDCIAGMVLECDRFDFDWELTAKLVRAGYSPVEIPVTYHSRSFSEGKKVRLLRDPWTWVVACARYRFAPIYGHLPSDYATGDLPCRPLLSATADDRTHGQRQGEPSREGRR